MYFSPRALRSATRHVISRAASVSTAASAISSWTSWKPAIGLPNCSRCWAYDVMTSTAFCARPVHEAASDIRPSSSADRATLIPSPSWPSSASAGTTTSSSVISAVSHERSPSLPWIGLGVKPAASHGTRNAETPARAGTAGPGHDQRDAGDVTVGDEDLRAVDPVAVALADCGRLERRRVRPVIRLGEAEAAERLPGGHRGQPVLLLLARSPTARPTRRPARGAPRGSTARSRRRGRAPRSPGSR